MSAGPAVMLGMRMPDVDVWSERVVVALGQNPGPFTGPGTNSYLLGTGARRILVDPGQGTDAYLPVLEQALERAGCEGIQEIVLTHGHPDHMGGVEQVQRRFGQLPVSKRPWPGNDERYAVPVRAIDEGDLVRCEGASLRAIHAPGHAPDHLCFVLEEEGALLSGDNVLGVGTTVIPSNTGDLGAYMSSLERLLKERPGRIYPAHGPCIEDGQGKLREYIAHRQEREQQILDALDAGASTIRQVVERVYAAYPKQLHAAAGQSVASHLLKLEGESRVAREEEDPLRARWRRA